MLGWRSRPLAELCTLVTDGSHFSPQTTDAGYPYITVRDIRNGKIDFENCALISHASFEELRRNGCCPRIGDVLFSKDGTVGKVALVDSPQEFVVLSSLAILRPNTSIVDAAYLSYVLKSPAFLESAIGRKTGVAIRRIILKNLKQISVPFPTLAEQRRIVVVLDEAFEGIATAKANAEKNLQNARELFASYLEQLFSADDEQMVRLRDLCDIKHGYAFNGAHFASDCDEQAPILLTPGNFTEDGRLQFSTRNTKRYTAKDIPHRFVLDVEDLVVVMTDLSSKMKILGAPAIVDRPQLLHNQRIGRVVGAQSRVATRYLYFFMRTAAYVNRIKKTATGTMVKHTAPSRILDATVPLPPLEQQAEIVCALDAVESQTRKLQANYLRRIEVLEDLEKLLLEYAFAGALVTKSADQVLEASV